MTWSRAPRPWQNFIARKEVRKPAEQTKRQPLSFLLAPPSPTLSSQQTSCLTEKSEDILPTLASVFIFFSPREIGLSACPSPLLCLHVPSLILVHQPSPFLALLSFPFNGYHPIHTSICPTFINLKGPTLSFCFSHLLSNQMSQAAIGIY